MKALMAVGGFSCFVETWQDYHFAKGEWFEYFSFFLSVP